MASPRNFPDTSRRDRGQATVEFVIVLPLILILTLTVVQLAIVLSERSRLEGITWNAVRAASVSDSPESTALRVTAELGGDTVITDVDVEGEWVTVHTELTVSTDVPLVGRFFPSITFDTDLTMLREPPLG